MLICFIKINYKHKLVLTKKLATENLIETFMRRRLVFFFFLESNYVSKNNSQLFLNPKWVLINVLNLHIKKNSKSLNMFI